LTVAVSGVLWRAITLAGFGVTVTLPTGTGITVTDDVPDFPSLVAVMVTGVGLAATPVTTPVLDTVATAVLLEAHVITRPVTTVPFKSFVVATSVVVFPCMMVAFAGATVTVPTGTGTIVTDAVPDFPSLVAVIVTGPPIATPVTTPAFDTVAIDVLLEAHVTTRPVRTVPLMSAVVAVSVPVCPTMIELAGGATVTVATGGGVTVTTDVPDFPSLVAVIVVVPAATPVTTPLADTVAAAVLLDVHTTTRFVTTVPLTSFTVATSVVVWPATTLAVAGATVTLPTAVCVAVTVELPLLPSLVAVIVAEPGATPVTTPVVETVAMAVLLDDHATARSVTTTPFASLTVAVSVVVWPTVTVAVGGDTVTLPTGDGVTVIADVPLFVSLVAVIVAIPPLTPVTTPAVFTIATCVLLELHETTRFVTTLPLASVTVAVSVAVALGGMASAGGDTTTLATATVDTVIANVAL
jgi:hypothetical protein